jgi:hypothetical protein
MQKVQPDNIELLLKHLPADTLASKLVTAYKQASPEKIPAALETVLSGDLRRSAMPSNMARINRVEIQGFGSAKNFKQ